MALRPLVVVVDDDASVRESLPDLLHELGYAAHVFASAKSFLASGGIADTQCLLVDIEMPGMTGIDLLDELRRRGYDIPTVFMTAHADVADRIRLADGRTAACLFKPFGEAALLGAIEAALGKASPHV